MAAPITFEGIKTPLAAGTIVHIAVQRAGVTDWSEKAIVLRVRAYMKERDPKRFDPLANGFSPVRFMDGGELLYPHGGLMAAADQSRKARAAFKPRSEGV